jgi:replicative DNA helicase
MPSIVEAERAVLAGVIQQPDLIDKVSPYLKDGAFYDNKNARIWEIILDIKKDDEVIDIISIVSRLTESEKTKGITPYYLTTLQEDLVSVELCEHYSKKVYEKYLLRGVIEKSRNIASATFENNKDVYDLLNETHTSIGELISIRPMDDFNMDELLVSTMDSIANSGQNLISTGFNEFDKLSGGMTRGELTIIGGRPGHGKTTMMVNMLKACIDNGYKVMLFNREMTNQEMLKKIVVLESKKLSYLNVRRGIINDLEDSAELKLSFEKVKKKYNSRVFKMFDHLKTFDESLLQAKKFKPDIIFDDYIQLISPKTTYSERRLQLEELVNDYKWLAKSIGASCVLLSQLNRSVESRDKSRPRLSDLAESGAIEQTAENVVFSFYPYKLQMANETSRNVIEMVGSKVRYGVSGVVELGFNGDKCKLYSSLSEMRKELLA